MGKNKTQGFFGDDFASFIPFLIFILLFYGTGYSD